MPVLVCYWPIGHESFIISHDYCYATHVVFLARRSTAPVVDHYPPLLPALTHRLVVNGRGIFSWGETMKTETFFGVMGILVVIAIFALVVFDYSGVL